MRPYPLSVVVALALPKWLEWLAVWLINRAADRLVASRRPRERPTPFGFGGIVDSFIGVNQAKKAMQRACAEAEAEAEIRRAQANREWAPPTCRKVAFAEVSSRHGALLGPRGGFHHITGNWTGRTPEQVNLYLNASRAVASGFTYYGAGGCLP